MLSIIVPVYNEEKNILSFLERITKILNKLGNYEIIFCLDPSSDNTESLIKNIYVEDKIEPEKINHCFESACSVVYPCYPEYLKKYSDKEQMNVMLNKSCLNNRL